jgi:hypothetical protein
MGGGGEAGHGVACAGVVGVVAVGGWLVLSADALASVDEHFFGEMEEGEAGGLGHGPGVGERDGGGE